MASQSTTKTTQATESNQEGEKSKSPIQPPPQRPPRMKSVPNRLHFGIDRAIRGVSDNIPEASSANPKRKGVSFEEPPKKKRSSNPSSEKGKKKKVEKKKTPTHSARTKRASNFQGQSSQGQASHHSNSSSHSQSEAEGQVPSIMENAIEDIYKHLSPQKISSQLIPLSPVLKTPISRSTSFQDHSAQWLLSIWITSTKSVI